MSSDLALRIRGLGKKYSIRHRDHDHVTLAQAALHRVRHPRGNAGREEFWALRDIDLDVPRGEVLGVIGHNGAGKSTLLKILSRITPPTTGRVEVFGRIGSLLEVGTGFHPELTGRENVYLNGSILGMKAREIDRQFDAIVEFSGVERFLDTPVKRFSSGMYVRLAFAVAAHLDTEILLLDEVLAVGDAEFQKRCLGKMGDVARDGRTVVLVSHQMPLVEQLAKSAVLLDHGGVHSIGPCDVIADQYLRISNSRGGDIDLRDMPRPKYDLSGSCRLTRARTYVHTDLDQVDLHIDLEFATEQFSSVPMGLVVHVLDRGGQAVGSGILPRFATDTGQVRATFDLSVLAHGTYGLTIALTSADPGFGHVNHDIVEDASSFTIANPLMDESGLAPRTWGNIRFPVRTVNEVAPCAGR